MGARERGQEDLKGDRITRHPSGPHYNSHHYGAAASGSAQQMMCLK